MVKSKNEQIESIKKEIEELENRKKRLLQAQKEQERKDTTKRLCKRAGLLESLLPDTVPLTDDLFKLFLEKTITTEHSRRILDGLTAQTAATPTPQGAGSAARANTLPTTKPTETAKETATGGYANGGNGARVNG